MFFRKKGQQGHKFNAKACWVLPGLTIVRVKTAVPELVEWIKRELQEE